MGTLLRAKCSWAEWNLRTSPLSFQHLLHLFFPTTLILIQSIPNSLDGSCHKGEQSKLTLMDPNLQRACGQDLLFIAVRRFHYVQFSLYGVSLNCSWAEWNLQTSPLYFHHPLHLFLPTTLILIQSTPNALDGSYRKGEQSKLTLMDQNFQRAHGQDLLFVAGKEVSLCLVLTDHCHICIGLVGYLGFILEDFYEYSYDLRPISPITLVLAC